MITNHRDFLNHPDYVAVYNEALKKFADNLLSMNTSSNMPKEELRVLVNYTLDLLSYNEKEEEDN